ncbi:MAG: flavodoxin family protein [Methanothrix sp.]|jgi:multimeric flavodoxin WrbA
MRCIFTKVIGIVGSLRHRGNTEYLVNEALSVLKTEDFEIELIKLSVLKVAPCEACSACGELKNCKIEDDFREIFEKMEAADGIILERGLRLGARRRQEG